ncbi:hypothetical protein PWT90_06542 [Aphanocladium album]|nr:hypothetical protein PWT90_06542 [Aphanocladium album]
MSKFIFHLPRELCTQIIDQIDQDDLIRVSATCRLCREELAPIIFRTISFSNTERSCSSALLAAKKYGRFVRRIIFHYHAAGESVTGGLLSGYDLRPAKSPHGGGLPRLRNAILRPDARNLLQGRHTKHVKAVEICCNLPRDFMTHENGYTHSDTWSEPWSRFAEEHYPWHALMTQVYKATARNATLSELILSSVTPMCASAWLTRSFRNLLSRLETFGFQMQEVEWNDSTQRYMQYEGYCQFTRGLPLHFFPALAGLQHLSLHSPTRQFLRYSPVEEHLVLALNNAFFPSLKSLKLHHFLVSKKFSDFLQTHLHKLSSLVLINCLISTSCDKWPWKPVLPGQRWAHFFAELTALQPLNLAKFSVEYDSKMILEQRPSSSSVPDASLLRGLPGAHAEHGNGFPYVTHLPGRNRKEYRVLYVPSPNNKLEDEQAYQHLQQLVKGNAERIERENREKNQGLIMA